MKKIFLIILLCVCALGMHAQNRGTVTGVVLDGATNEPMWGVAVVVEGASSGGTSTGADGTFSLPNVPDNAVLKFTVVGYNAQTVAVNGRTHLPVTMNEAAVEIDDIVVIGYGVARRSDITSSIASVKGKDLTAISSGNAMNSLQGKTSGVQVNAAGGPGDVARVIIRGVSTVNGTDPLYVIDGVPLSYGSNINFINPSDIESMEVLKDASASAIYGTRASNGVILITTKKGHKGETTFEFNASVGISHIKKVRSADAATYKNVYYEKYENDGISTADITSGRWNALSDTNVAANGGTDWWDQTIKDYALTQNYNLSFSGGSDKATFSGSFGFFQQDSQYDYGYWRRFTGRFNMDYKFNDWAKFGIDFNPKYEMWDDTPNQWGAILAMDPTTPVYKPRSEWETNEFNNYQRAYNNQTWNPVASVNRSKASRKEFGLLTNPYLQFEPIKGLILKTQLGLNLRFRMSDDFTPEFFLHELEQNTSAVADRNSQNWYDWSWTNTANYMKSFGKHNFNVMAGFTMEKFTEYQVKAGRDGIPTNEPNLQYPSAGTGSQYTVEGIDYRSSYLSYLGRIMYNYDGRYYLTASIRRDGSSKFPSGNKYANFPAVSVAWRLSQEEFMKNQDIVNNAKIRFGWGRLGNSNIDSGAYISSIGSADYAFGGDRVVGTAISQVANKNLKWETVEDINIGIDLSFLDNRLDVTAEWFKKNSKDMLMQNPNLLVSGYPMWNAELWTNIGEMQAKGWELSLNWRDRIKKVDYSVGVNMSSIKNKAKKLNDDAELFRGGFGGDYAIKNVAGGEISRFFLYQFDGIFQNWTEVNAHTSQSGTALQSEAQPGDMRFKDVNGDGVLDANDKIWAGSAFPDLTLGVNLSVAYEGFDFSANFYGAFGAKIFNSTKSGLYSGIDGQNVLADAYAKAWRGEGTTNNHPRLSQTDANKNYSTPSTWFLESGSYFRCKQMQLGYTLPKKWTGSTSIRVSVSAQNLFTITPYSGMDPERAALGTVMESGFDGYGYPLARTFLFGVNMRF